MRACRWHFVGILFVIEIIDEGEDQIYASSPSFSPSFPFSLPLSYFILFSSSPPLSLTACVTLCVSQHLFPSRSRNTHFFSVSRSSSCCTRTTSSLPSVIDSLQTDPLFSFFLLFFLSLWPCFLSHLVFHFLLHKSPFLPLSLTLLLRYSHQSVLPLPSPSL